MNIKRFLQLFFGCIAITLIFFAMGWMFTMIIDMTISLDNDGELRTKTIESACYDRDNSLIQSLTCEKDIYCSKWGLVSNYKCDSKRWNKLSDISGSTKQ